MKISEAFSYQFEDAQWPTKLGAGALISLVPILNFAVVGYEVGIVRNVTAGLREPLPQWDDFGKKWLEGLLLTLAGLVYSLPVFAAIGLVAIMLGASGVLSHNSNGPVRAIAAANVLVLACFLVFLVLYSLLLSLLRPIILVLFSKEGTFASCFRLDEVSRVISRQPGTFFTTWVVIIVAALAVGLLVGFINVVIGWIPCIGWAIGLLLGLGSAMYLLTVDGYIFGQFRLAAFGASEGGDQATRQLGNQA